MTRRGICIAIDGPAASGKGTLARMLAQRLNYRYIDTGAMYRACTLRAMRDGIDLTDALALAGVVDGAKIELVPAGEGCRVLLDGEDVSDAIRTRDVTGAIHHLADCPAVRERLVRQQQRLASASATSVVAEGRDLGSVVYPDADVKIYLDASVERRAERRHREAQAAAGDDRETAGPGVETTGGVVCRRDRSGVGHWG